MTQFKQSKVDYIVNQDYTREQLAKQLVEARYNSEKYRAESQWLDELATHYRDSQGDADYGKVCRDVYENYEQEIKSIKDRYLNKTS
jgi:hypothetical protein